MGYRADRNLTVISAFFSILTGIGAVLTALIDFASQLKETSLLVPLTIGSFACFMLLYGIRKLIVLLSVRDTFEVLNTHIIVEPLDPEGRIVRIQRVRYLQLIQDGLASFYEGNLMSDGEINSVEAELHLVDAPEPASEERNSTALKTEGLDTIKKKGRNIYEFEFIPPEPLGKRASLLRKNIYKQVVRWEAIDGFREDTEFYILSIGQSTREVNLEIRCNSERPFVPNSSRIVKTQSAGLRVKKALDRSKYLNQTEDTIHCRLVDPPKGDEYKVYWDWKKVASATTP